jgi:hypothetical protein
VSGWGELRGIRVEGELVPVTTRIVVASHGWKKYANTGHWRTRDQSYARSAESIVTSGQVAGISGIAPLSFRKTVRDLDERTCEIDIELQSTEAMEIDGVFLFVGVPADRFGIGSATLLNTVSGGEVAVPFPVTSPADHHLGFGRAKGFRFENERQTVTVNINGDSRREVIIRDDRASETRQVNAFFPLHAGRLEAGQSIHQKVTFRVDGAIDRTPAQVTIDRSPTNAVWEGIGGNLCWGTESPTVTYYLDHLDLAWARVNFPWNLWQPDAGVDPATIPLENQPKEIRECIRIARELHRRGIPLMVAVWNAPEWAHRPRGTTSNDPQQFGRTIRLDPAKRDQIARSITGYLTFFEREVGVAPRFFSFNEPNLGINVRQTPEDHASDNLLIGRAFELAGLQTKLLLGDVNEPRAVDFVKSALADAESMKFVGAVSIHSWNDGTDDQLLQWREHAQRAGLPLYVAEAGHDPDAHRYRPILDETWYAIDDAELNLRCINLARAATIMHWQLTPDYGMVHADDAAPGGVRLTQRWFQYSQIDRFTPRGGAILTATSDTRAITAAAVEKDGRLTIHLTNREADRVVKITGFSAPAAGVTAYLTDQTRQQSTVPAPTIHEGSMEVRVPSLSMVTLVLE